MVALLVALLLVAVLVLCWLITVVGLPGNWLMVAATAVYAALSPLGAIGWRTVIVLGGLALLGELIELAASAGGATRAGGSRRSAMLAIVGSLVGGIAGAIVGLPIPLFGPLVAALLFGGLGAMVGAVLGERWAGRDLIASLRVGRAAFRGRLLGTVAKVLVGGAMVIAVVAVLIFG